MATENGFLDRAITCAECSEQFIWTSGEQKYFQDKGLLHAPKRCAPCREAKKARVTTIEVRDKQPLVLYDAVCSGCFHPTKVPFEPRPGRLVYCRSCFQAGRRGY
jgi:CxxC-x17-CxxC domain-containing protein